MLREGDLGKVVWKLGRSAINQVICQVSEQQGISGMLRERDLGKVSVWKLGRSAINQVICQVS
jgi:hypothetical protein